MNSLNESIASWATILGTVYNLFGLIQSGAWLTVLVILFVGISVVLSIYAHRERGVLEAASIAVEGRSLDSLNLANLHRRVTSSIVVQEARHTATVRGEDLDVAWEYVGYCAREGGAIEFSIDSDNNIPFNDLTCFAYDLRKDPNRAHKIRPLLLSEDGISKKVVVPLLDSLATGEAFTVRLECFLPGCMKTGVEYYASTLSFKQDQIRNWTACLRFIGESPSWVRVYEIDSNSHAQLQKELRPVRKSSSGAEYVDIKTDIAGRSATVYTFLRSLPPRAQYKTLRPRRSAWA